MKTGVREKGVEKSKVIKIEPMKALVGMFLFLLIKLLRLLTLTFTSVQFSSVAHSCPALSDPMSCSMTGLPVQHQLPEPT